MDGVSKYMHERNLDAALNKAADEYKDSKEIRIDGTVFKEKYGLHELVEAVLHFLYLNEEYSIVLSLPFEEHKAADVIAYEHTNKLIQVLKFSEEMHKQDYIIMVWSITRTTQHYLKIINNMSVFFDI